MNQKTLKRFDDLSPFSELLDTCLPYSEDQEQTNLARGASSTLQQPPTGPLRVTLCCGGVQKVATIKVVDTTTTSLYAHLAKIFQQKFKTFSKRGRYEFQVSAHRKTVEQGHIFRVTPGNDDRCVLSGGETIQYSSFQSRN